MPSRSRSLIYGFISIFLGLLVALSGVEFGLAWYAERIKSAENIDPGFLVYDSQLGWRMAANWRGRHRHYDFDAAYSTNRHGLRGTWPDPDANSRRIAVLGDSFTFGLGVDESDTFVARLNREHPNIAYLNAGLAGYSTDQQYLYLSTHLASWQAGEVWLVVHLANDLFDNLLEYPLQAEMAKPYFVLENGRPALRNVPVPLNPKQPAMRRKTLADLVLGTEHARAMAANPLFRSRLIHRLGFFSASSEDIERAFPQRFSYSLRLFFELVAAMRQRCSQEGAALTLILMPGASFIDRPGSYSAAFQDYFRRAILSGEGTMEVPVIDLAGRLREWHENHHEPLFFPNEGHLNARGNQIVGDLLGRRPRS